MHCLLTYRLIEGQLVLDHGGHFCELNHKMRKLLGRAPMDVLKYVEQISRRKLPVEEVAGSSQVSPIHTASAFCERLGHGRNMLRADEAIDSGLVETRSMSRIPTPWRLSIPQWRGTYVGTHRRRNVVRQADWAMATGRRRCDCAPQAKR